MALTFMDLSRPRWTASGKKIKEHGWKTNIQQSSQCTGKEKKVDASMNVDITETACSNQSGTIAIVSGDADFEPSIKSALKHDWKVEVYSWEHATSKDLSSRTDVKLVYLNEDLERITFVERLFKFRGGRLHPNTKWVLLKMKSDAIPENPSDAWCKEIEKVTRWPFQYYWLGIDDLVLIFRLNDPSGHLFDIFRFLKQVNKRPLAGMKKQYYDSSDDEDFSEDFSDSDNAYNDEPMPGSSYTQKSLYRGYDEPCQFKFCCVQGVDCYDAHTEEEMKYFQENGGGYPIKKIDLCRFYARGRCNHKNSKYCNYAHGEKYAYCPNCGKKWTLWSKLHLCS